MKTVQFPLFALTAVLMFSACSENHESQNKLNDENSIPVELLPLEKSESGNILPVSGTFTTDDETMLSFKTGGLVSNIYVKEGDKISKGQLLASLDVTEIAAAVQQAQLAVDKATRDFQRAQNLYNDSVAALEQLQNAQTAKDMAIRQLTAAQFNLTYSQIRAKADGVIMRKLANQGQVVGPGIPVLQTSSKGSVDWLLKVAVSDREWSDIRIRDSAMIFADVFDGKTITGFVSSKSENADPFTGSFSVEIKLVDGKNLNLASGMFGKAEIHSSSKKSGWTIPYEALLDGNGTNGFVFVTNDKLKVLKVPVKISKLQNDSVVIGSGLESYKFLVTSGSAYLTDQSLITVKNTK